VQKLLLKNDKKFNMGITQLFDQFYKKLPDEDFQKKFITGQFCYIASPQLDVIPWVMEVKRADPTGHEKIDFKIREMSNEDYRRNEELPLYYLKLRHNEELIIHKSKRRPGIIISAESIYFEDIAIILKKKRKKHLQQECLLVVPLFSMETALSPTGFPPEMVVRIKALMYNAFFYCPKIPIGANRIEGIARLDRVQVIIKSSFPGNKHVFKPIDIAFTDEVTGFFINMLREWLGIRGNPEDIENLRTVRSIVAETLPSN
jgi:hypothetical protein